MNRVFFVIASDRSAAIRAAFMIRANEIPNLYPTLESAYKALSAYPGPMRYRYWVYEVKMNAESAKAEIREQV